MLPALPFFLADIIPAATPEEWGISLKAIFVAGMIVYLGASTWANLRRKPSIETEVDQKITHATSALERRIETKLSDLKEQIQKHSDRQDRLQTSIETGFRDIQRSIGRLEGKIESNASES